MRCRAALYARVSSTSQAGDLAPQIDRLRRYVAARWPEADLVEFSDVESGTHLRRPKLVELLELVDRRRVRVVVIEKLDRLSRSLADGIQLIDRLARCDVGLVALDQPIDTSTPAGRAGVHLLQVFAEWQRDDLRERSLKGIAAAKARGVRFGRPALRFDLEDVQRRLSLGASLGAIASELGVSRFALRRRLLGVGHAARSGRTRNRSDGAGDPPSDSGGTSKSRRSRSG